MSQTPVSLPENSFSSEQKEYLSGFAAGAGAFTSMRSTFAGTLAANGQSSEAPVMIGPDALQLQAQAEQERAGKKLVPEEKAKRERHPLDRWDNLVEAAEKGVFPKGTDVLMWKYHGLFYVAPAQDSFMCRLRFYGGLMDSNQMRSLAKIADRFGGGYVDCTTRGNLQIREIKANEAVAFLKSLQENGFVSRGSGADNIRKAHPSEVHLTVGVVRYNRDGSPRGRKGVASSFLSERMAGHKVGVFVQPSHGFRPPSDGDAPLIMVGPGTGIAPFRAFLEERYACGHGGKNWLFFGDQRAATDYLYQSELEAWAQDGLLSQLDLAWSRDGQNKVYVQHKMLEHGAELWRWLEDGGHFTVCGDASRMAKDVDKALHQIIARHGAKGEEGAKEYIAQMTKEGRYGRDVY